MSEHVHEFKQYRDGRPQHCKCGAWLRTRYEVVTDEPLPERYGTDSRDR